MKMKLLLINPNSLHSMTKAMELAAKATPLSDTIQIDTYTAPASAPKSINNGQDIDSSTEIVLADLLETFGDSLETYDAMLVACYSVHTLVPSLAQRYPRAVVTGIFEASILTALSLVTGVDSPKAWGIVTTGKFWEKHLADGVNDFMGCHDLAPRFRGVYSTGLTAGDLHSLSAEQVRDKVKTATLKLLDAGNVACVALGCGAMTGLEQVIREAAREAYGREKGDELYIVDGVKGGMIQLHQMLNCQTSFR